MYPNPNLDPDLISNDCYTWVDGNWKDLRELELVEEAVVDVAGVLGGSIHFRSAFHNRPVDISRKIEFDGAGLALPFIDIWLDNSTFPSNSMRYEAFSRYTIAHELGHIWDIRENLNLSKELGFAVGTIQQRCVYISGPNTCITDYYYSPTSAIERAAGDPRRLDPKNPKDSDKYAYKTMYEDWAETFASFVYKSYWSTYRGGENLVSGGIRWTFVENQISNLP